MKIETRGYTGDLAYCMVKEMNMRHPVYHESIKNKYYIHLEIEEKGRTRKDIALEYGLSVTRVAKIYHEVNATLKKWVQGY